MMTPRDRTNPITDHALLRYMEREQGIDVEALRNELATDYVRAACQAGATKIIMGKTEFRICPSKLVRTVVNRRNKTGRAKAYVDEGKHTRRKKRVNTRLSDRDRHKDHGRNG